MHGVLTLFGRYPHLFVLSVPNPSWGPSMIYALKVFTGSLVAERVGLDTVLVIQNGSEACVIDANKKVLLSSINSGVVVHQRLAVVFLTGAHGMNFHKHL